MRYEQSDFPPDPPPDAQAATWQPTPPPTRVEELERRLLRARWVMTGLLAVIAGLLLVIALSLARDRELLLTDDEGRPRIQSSVGRSGAVIEFLDERGVLTATIGERDSQGLVELHDRQGAGPAPAVGLWAHGPTLSLQRADSSIRLGVELEGHPNMRFAGGDARDPWLLTADPSAGLLERRPASPPPPPP